MAVQTLIRGQQRRFHDVYFYEVGQRRVTLHQTKPEGTQKHHSYIKAGFVRLIKVASASKDIGVVCGRSRPSLLVALLKVL